MSKPPLSREARAVLAHITQRSFEDPAFEKEMNDLLKKSDKEVLKGLAHYLEKKFPDWVDNSLEEEILKHLKFSAKKGGGAISISRVSRNQQGMSC